MAIWWTFHAIEDLDMSPAGEVVHALQTLTDIGMSSKFSPQIKEVKNDK